MELREPIEPHIAHLARYSHFQILQVPIHCKHFLDGVYCLGQTIHREIADILTNRRRTTAKLAQNDLD